MDSRNSDVSLFLVTRNLFFEIFHQIRFKPTCLDTEARLRLDNSIATEGMVLPLQCSRKALSDYSKWMCKLITVFVFSLCPKNNIVTFSHDYDSFIFHLVLMLLKG